MDEQNPVSDAQNLVTVRISFQLAKQLIKIAAERGLSQEKLTEDLIRKGLTAEQRR